MPRRLWSKWLGLLPSVLLAIAGVGVVDIARIPTAEALNRLDPLAVALYGLALIAALGGFLGRWRRYQRACAAGSRPPQPRHLPAH